MTERRQLSLLQRTSLMIIGGVLMALLFSFLLNVAARWAINTFYMSEDAVRARNESLAGDLQQYVAERSLASTDYDELENWISLEPQKELFVYEGDTVYRPGGREHGMSLEDSLAETELKQRGYGIFVIRFSNGERRTVIADESDVTLKSNLRAVMIVVSLLIFAGTLLLYTRRLARYMHSFSKDVAAVSSGEAEHVDEKRGFSELSGIAHNVNHMHDVITERTRSAQHALQANRELITALSHDIRTPLTSLIAYLELLGMEDDNLTDTQRQYLERSSEKADRIRELTGELFRYFLIFSDAKPKVNIEPIDAQILLQQMLGEYAIELEEHGYRLQTQALQTPCMVHVDPGLLRRVMENLFSNVRKYADPDEPVRLSAEIRSDMLCVRISNAVCIAPPNHVESSHIGLRTCAAIMTLLNGTIETGQSDGRFTVDLALPLALETETGQ